MDDQGTKAVCFSCWFRESPEYVKAILNTISVISIVTLIWIIFTFIFRSPKFGSDMAIVGSLMRILSLIIQFVTLVYTCMTLSKFKKNNDPLEGYVMTYAKVEIGILGFQLFLLFGMIIHTFLTIVDYLESYDFDFDTAFFAFSKVILTFCTLLTVWELYMLVMVLYRPVDPNRNSQFRSTARVKESPIIIPKEAEPESGDEDDLPVMNTKGGAYIGDSTNNDTVKPKDPQVFAPEQSAQDAEEDDFLMPTAGNNLAYLDDSDSTERNDQPAQFYKPGDAQTKPLKDEGGEGPL